MCAFLSSLLPTILFHVCVFIKFTTNVRVRRKMRKDKMSIRILATYTFKINRVMNDLQASLNDRLAEISADILEEKWNAFMSILNKVSKMKFSTAVRKHEDLFDGNRMELEELINNRNQARNNMLSKNTKSVKAKYRTCCQLLRERCIELKK